LPKRVGKERDNNNPGKGKAFKKAYILRLKKEEGKKKAAKCAAESIGRAGFVFVGRLLGWCVAGPPLFRGVSFSRGLFRKRGNQQRTFRGGECGPASGKS